MVGRVMVRSGILPQRPRALRQIVSANPLRLARPATQRPLVALSERLGQPIATSLFNARNILNAVPERAKDRTPDYDEYNAWVEGFVSRNKFVAERIFYSVSGEPLKQGEEPLLTPGEKPV